jgi:2-methylcitrate dehydratase PrpD
MPSVVSFIHDLCYDDLSDDVRHMAENCLLDLIATQVGATTTRLSHIIRDYAASAYAGGDSTIFFDGRRLHPAGAALANAMTIDGLDCHDGHRLTKGHVGVNIIPAAAAMLQSPQRQREASGRELIAALVMGYEVASRAAIALHATVADYHTSGAWGAVGCAAVAARALGLDESQTRHALGIAEYYGPRSQMMRVIDHPTMLKDGSGWGAMAGVSAGFMAAGGFTGAPAITVEGRDVAGLWQDLGNRWRILETYFKPHAICRWAQPAMEGAVKISGEQHLAPENIQRVVVETFYEATCLNHPHPKDTEEAQYSLPFPLAATLIHGNLGHRQLVGDALHDPRVLELADKVELVSVDDLNNRFPAERLARVSVYTTDGSVHHSGMVAPRGDPESPWSDADFEGKYRWLAEGLLEPDRAEAILAAVRGVTEMDEVSRLFDLLAPPLLPGDSATAE